MRPLIFRNSFRNIQKIKNGLRPLIFRNFFRNIQKIKNGLRIICYAPHSSRLCLATFPPRGRLDIRQDFPFFSRFSLLREKAKRGSLQIMHYFKAQSTNALQKQARREKRAFCAASLLFVNEQAKAQLGHLLSRSESKYCAVMRAFRSAASVRRMVQIASFIEYVCSEFTKRK